jgi:hypothetical protein
LPIGDKEMSEYVRTLGGTKATKPLSDFMLTNVGLGKTFYVDSVTGSNTSNGKTPKTAVATLDYAVGLCRANKGDVIYCLPGHTETKSTAGDIATLDVAGITIVGIGEGASIRPTFNLGHADATMTVSAANVKVSGLRFVSTAADVAVGLTLSATSDNSIIEECKFRDSGASLEFLVAISVAAAAHGIKIRNNDFKTTAAAGSNNAILSAAVTDLLVTGNTVYGKYATGAMLTSGVLTRAIITDNIMVNAEAAIAIALNGTTSTGVLARNLLGGTTSMAAALTGDNAMWCFENYISGAAAVSGVLNPAADAD